MILRDYWTSDENVKRLKGDNPFESLRQGCFPVVKLRPKGVKLDFSVDRSQFIVQQHPLSDAKEGLVASNIEKDTYIIVPWSNKRARSVAFRSTMCKLESCISRQGFSDYIVPIICGILPLNIIISSLFSYSLGIEFPNILEAIQTLIFSD